MKFAEHLSCQTPPDATFYTKKFIFTKFKDYYQHVSIKFPADIYWFKVSIRTKSKIFSKLKRKASEDVNYVFMSINAVLVSFVNFGHISHRLLVFL